MLGFFSSSVIQNQAQPSLIPRCGSCGLFKECHSPKMKPYGKGQQGVLIVGEAPGQNEDERGRPFIGKAGQFLRKTLRQLGIDLNQDALTTNSIICRPEGNKTPDAKQILYCRPNLLNTIRQFEPRVIVTLGRCALASVMQKYWKGDVGPLERWVGWKIPIEDHWICPTYHPSYLLRTKNSLLDRIFRSHLEAAFAIEEDPPKRIDLESQIECLYDDGEIAEAIGSFDLDGGWLAVDYETNCIKPEWPESRIFSCALSNGKRTISYPWTSIASRLTGELLKSPRTRKIASNAKFEERWTRSKFGHGVANWGWDTMLAAHCLDNRTGICSLKFQSLVRLGVPSYNENVEPYLDSLNGPYNRIKDIGIGTLLLYGGIDAFLEYKLAMRQRKDMGFTKDVPSRARMNLEVAGISKRD